MPLAPGKGRGIVGRQPSRAATGGGIAPDELPRYEAGGGPMTFGQDASMAHHTAHPTTGFLHSAIPGRTDLIHANPPVGAYVLPADVVSGLAEGNSVAGAHLLDQALKIGPFGTALPAVRRGGVGVPSPPPVFSGAFMAPAAKRGGRQGDQEVGKPTPILAAGGEYIVPPEIVALWGHGDLKKGHDVLDQWVVRKRREIAKEMLKLPGPKKK